MSQTADESCARVSYVIEYDLFSWVVFSGLLKIPHAWSCVVTISNRLSLKQRIGNERMGNEGMENEGRGNGEWGMGNL